MTTGASGSKKVARFLVEFEIANEDEMIMVQRGFLSADKARRKRLTGVVQPGTSMLVLPGRVVKDLGLPLTGKVLVRRAGRRHTQRWQAGAVYLELLSRHSTFSAVVEPRRKDALIGFIALQALDLVVDHPHGRLVPRDPRDPRGPVYEIE